MQVFLKKTSGCENLRFATLFQLHVEITTGDTSKLWIMNRWYSLLHFASGEDVEKEGEWMWVYSTASSISWQGSSGMTAVAWCLWIHLHTHTHTHTHVPAESLNRAYIHMHACLAFCVIEGIVSEASAKRWMMKLIGDKGPTSPSISRNMCFLFINYL